MQPQTLTLLLQQNIQILELLDQVAAEIACNARRAAGGKLRDACERLKVTNNALAREIRAWSLTDYELAAALEQSNAASKAALHDVLTGLPNRALFTDRLEHGIAQAIRHDWTLAVMFMDLADFKSVNDTYGHAAGDVVVRMVAHRLKAGTREEDTVSRHGGDEFTYLVNQIHDYGDIGRIAEKLKSAVEAPFELDLGHCSVTLRVEIDIGIAVFREDGLTVEQLIQRADDAMYRAKQSKFRRLSADIATAGDR
jgi:diguanylate cyclase (GGDEF)-like protein